MNMDDRIAITGAGIISAIGAGKEETLRSLLAGRSGIGPLRHLRTSHREALGQASNNDDEPHDLVALVSGTTVGGMDITENLFLEALGTGGNGDMMRSHTCGSSTRDIADYFGIFDLLTTTSLIRSGRADVVVAGGAECLTKYHLNGFNSLMILDSEPCRPFDASRAGLNLGEGAGFLVLESHAHAQARGTEPLAFLDGYGNACDAFHQTASSPDGDGAYKAMNEAIAMAGLEPRDIDYVNAHGTGTVNNDESESRALKRTFGEDMPPVSSTKSFTGHTTSASGGIESVICILAMLNGFIPANLGWKTPFEGGIIPYVDTPANPSSGCASSARKVQLEHVLCNSFAFGGNDTSLLFSRI